LVRTRVYTEDLAGLERAVAKRAGPGGVALPVAAHHRVVPAVGEHAT
jgi:hypothetical protein